MYGLFCVDLVDFDLNEPSHSEYIKYKPSKQIKRTLIFAPLNVGQIIHY